MADQISNDNDLIGTAATRAEPDAHGQAAMLLVESLIHSLVARSVISLSEAVEIVDTAAEVEFEIAAELGDPPAQMQKSLSILAAISSSLQNDLPTI